MDSGGIDVPVNVTADKLEHSWNALVSMTVTSLGIVISDKDVQLWKALVPMVVS